LCLPTEEKLESTKEKEEFKKSDIRSFFKRQ
jgi:hypothetical protein